MTISYKLYEAGYCTHCERITRKSGQLKTREYPAICALIKHPQQGYLLFDTGYSERFNVLTQNFPASLYRRLTPATIPKPLSLQLEEDGISPSSIQYIVISHFHADHIGGLCDFPNAQFICHEDALKDIRDKKGIKALLSGFLPDLLPKDFYDRCITLKETTHLPQSMSPFKKAYPLFEDEQILAVSLPGHAKGQIGLYFTSNKKEIFLIADSCWHQETFQSLDYPSDLTYLIHQDKKAYQNTINKLHAVYQSNPSIDMIPSHCQHIRHRIDGVPS